MQCHATSASLGCNGKMCSYCFARGPAWVNPGCARHAYQHLAAACANGAAASHQSLGCMRSDSESGLEDGCEGGAVTQEPLDVAPRPLSLLAPIRFAECPPDGRGNMATFAAVKPGVHALTWGGTVWGGDSAGVWKHLAPRNVHHIWSTVGAFAAIQANGVVVTWGHPSCGGKLAP